MSLPIIESLPIYLILTSLIAYILIVLYLYLNQVELIFLPRRAKIHKTPASVGLAFEQHILKIGTNDCIFSWFIPATNKNIQTTILFCHGHAGNLEDRVEFLQLLHKLGTNIIAFDYRGYGESIGKTSEKNTYIDAQSIYNFLIKTKHIPENKIVIFGRSLGGGIACELARNNPNAGALILDSTFISLPEIAKKYYPLMPVHWAIVHRYENIKKIPEISIPKLIIHSKQDDVIPFKHGVQLFEKAQQPKRFLALPKGGHNECFLQSQGEYISSIINFLKELSLL